MLVIVPPQIYCERLANGAAFSSYFEFWRTVFDLVPYPAGNTSWHHLWFVLYLFIYAALAVPVLALLRSATGARWQRAFGEFAARGPAIWLLALPVVVAQLALRWRWPTTHGLVDDWANFTFQGVFFLYGILIGTDVLVWDRITSARRISLALGLVVLGSLLVDDALGVRGGYPYGVEFTLRSFLTWFWILAAAGYGKRYLSFRNRFLDFASEGIYPFYILHQTAIIVLGSWILGSNVGAWPKFGWLLTSSFLVSWLLYAVAIRPFAWIRPLFGMKRRRRPRLSEACVTRPPEVDRSLRDALVE
jgi:glucan biosynthesis protein C